MGREMYEVRWQKSLRNNLRHSDQKSVQLERSSDDSDMEYITSIVGRPEMIHAVTQEHDYPRVIYTEMLVGKAVVKFQVDSGASVNVISADLVADKMLEPTTKTLQTWNDTTLTPGFSIST